MRKLRLFLYQTRGFYPFLAMALILFLKHVTSSRIGLNTYLVVLILSVIVLVYRAWAAGFIGTPFQMAEGPMVVMITAGPYAHVRNPMYLSAMILGLLFAVMSGGWYSFLIWAIGYGLVYHLVVLQEEELLHAKFGEPYATYCRTVPRWIPAVKAIESRVGDFKLNGKTLRNVLAETAILSAFWFLSWWL